jgi:hypothetical protein
MRTSGLILLMLFSLFRQHETVGVFVVESTLDTPFDSTMADVVISLDMREDNGYEVRHIRLDKSRYQKQVYGWHPFRTIALDDPERETPAILGKTTLNSEGEKRDGDQPRHGIVVFPSLHYVVLRSGEGQKTTGGKANPWENAGDHWGIKAFSGVLPGNLREGSVIVIEGPRGTFKTNLAMTFLAQGLQINQSGLLIRLHDLPLLVDQPDKTHWPTLSEDVYVDESAQFWDALHPLGKTNAEEAARWRYLAEPKKAGISVWEFCAQKSSGNPETKPRLFEADFKSGALLPEELVQIVWDIIFRWKIERVVLDDVSEIGAAYPFLHRSSTSGDFFLPAMAHVMRNHQIDFVVTGTTGALPEGDEAVGRIRAVADEMRNYKLEVEQLFEGVNSFNFFLNITWIRSGFHTTRSVYYLLRLDMPKW